VDAEPKLRRLLPEEVAAQIQAKILDGSFAPGDRLPPERTLASQLHVNRSSVREAL
jgi:GntR family transcriptional repressor for pyruvate dehydrogenase complex